MKYLIWLAIAYIAYLAYKKFNRTSSPQDTQKQASAPRNGTINMVQCAHCGMHLPHIEALECQGLHYCSPDHLALGQKK